MAKAPKITSKRSEIIRCPNCGAEELAHVLRYEGVPFEAKIHDCEMCGYTIMESEWQTIEKL